MAAYLFGAKMFCIASQQLAQQQPCLGIYLLAFGE